MKIIKGDLIQLAKAGQFDAIIHGCNCFCTMGAGIAALIREQFPSAYQADLNTPMGDRQKLGTYSSAAVKNKDTTLIILNAYTQFHYSGRGTLVDYEAVESVFTLIKNDFSGMRFGYPKIGAGLARGDWQKLSHIIDTALEGENHSLVIYEP